VELSAGDRALLDDRDGEAAALAMRIVVEMAEIIQAERLIDVASAHVDGCLYHGQAGLDFVERLVTGAGRVRIPTTLNVGALDLLHPEHGTLDAETAAAARRQMDAYVELGCRPTWTCAPYQLPGRPSFGEHIAWAESNAIVFANSVLGARTNRYGDFLDVCAAITGRVPFAGLHRDEERRARIVFRLEGVAEGLLDQDVLYPVLGHLVGREAGSLVPAIVGLPGPLDEDRLKALGAAAASSGSVGLVHFVGVTPEAPTLDAALGGGEPEREVIVTLDRLAAARDELSTAEDGEISAVCLGTPHASLAELEHIAELVAAERPRVPLSVNLGRGTLQEAERNGTLRTLHRAGVELVTDTCTYLGPVLREVEGTVMTDSAKWAWYAPANLGVEVVFGSLRECVRSAVRGRVWRDPSLWTA
jgi:predicted aconitase